MDDNEVKIEKIPVGLVTMLLHGYERTIKWLIIVLVVMTIGWASTAYHFVNYLRDAEFEVTSYGDVTESQIDNKT